MSKGERTIWTEELGATNRRRKETAETVSGQRVGRKTRIRGRPTSTLEKRDMTPLRSSQPQNPRFTECFEFPFLNNNVKHSSEGSSFAGCGALRSSSRFQFKQKQSWRPWCTVEQWCRTARCILVKQQCRAPAWLSLLRPGEHLHCPGIDLLYFCDRFWYIVLWNARK